MEYAEKISESDAKHILQLAQYRNEREITDFLKERYGFDLHWDPQQMSGYLCLEKRGRFTLLLTILTIRYGQGLPPPPPPSLTNGRSQIKLPKNQPTVAKWRKEFHTQEKKLWGSHWGTSAKQGEGVAIARLFQTCAHLLSLNSKNFVEERTYSPGEISITFSHPQFTHSPNSYSMPSVDDYKITVKEVKKIQN